MDNSLTTQVKPEPINVANVTRSSAYMAALTDYRITFTVVNPVPAAGFFRVIIPIDQAVSPTNGPTCKNSLSQAPLASRIVFKTTTDVWIDIAQSCSGGCAASAQISIDLQGLTNPSSFNANQATSSWQIYTMNANKEYIDGNSTNLRALPALYGVVSTISALQLDENFVGRQAILQIGIMPRTDLTLEAIFDLYFPDSFSLPRVNTFTQFCEVVIGSKIPITC